MKFRYYFSLLLIACLYFVSCQSKGRTTEKTQNEKQDAETEATEPMDSRAGDTVSIDKDHGMDFSKFAAAIAEVNAQSPQEYPKIVTPLPESKNAATIETAELMKMLESWNPSLREQAARCLSERGDEVLSVLGEGMESGNWRIRAGSATATAAILKNNLSAMGKEEKESYTQKNTSLIDQCIILTRDERLEVRVAALFGLSAVAPQTAKAAMAVLALCDDPDAYLAQDAMIALDKKFNDKALEKDEMIEAFKKALRTPLPRGKGHIVRVIMRMSPEAQEKFIPDLFYHLDWQPMRDTMFGQGGQADAIKLLTEKGETDLVKRLPKLMGKFERGGGLFLQCLASAKAFGNKAKPILPELKEILADCKANGKEANIRPTRDVEQSLAELEKTIRYIESL